MFLFPLFSIFIFIYSSCWFKPTVCWYFTSVTDSTFESFISDTTVVTTQDLLETSEVSSTNIYFSTMIPTTFVEFSSVTTDILPSFIGISSRIDILTTHIDVLSSQEISKTSDLSSTSNDFPLSTQTLETKVSSTDIIFTVSSGNHATTESSLINTDILSSPGIHETTKASSTEETQQPRISVELFAGSLCAVVIVMVVAFTIFYQSRRKSFLKNFRNNSKHSGSTLYENRIELDQSNYQDLTPVRDHDDQSYAVTLNTNTYYNINS